ncbi:MAG: DinB family protein [Saprospiraceae bacterium]|nr:DinB family protein [Saprospiraceae bacterium]
MNKFGELFRFDCWVTGELLKTTIQLADPPMRAVLLCSHLLNAQRIWISRILGETIHPGVWEPQAMENWMAFLAKNDEGIKGVIATDDFHRIVHYRNTKGESYRNTVEDILQHLLLHSAYHRGQIAQLIRPDVDSLPLMDYIFFARDQM